MRAKKLATWMLILSCTAFVAGAAWMAFDPQEAYSFWDRTQFYTLVAAGIAVLMSIYAIADA